MIILLNGTSSSGKTTIAKILQKKYSGVLLLYGVDIMVQGAFPEKCDFPPYDEKAIRLVKKMMDGRPVAQLVVSPYMYPVYKASVRFYKILSEQGYDLIVDEVLFDNERIRQYFELLSGETVYFIGVKPDKEVVIEREKARKDRILGLAEGLYDKVYDPAFTYDLLLDTGRMMPEELADKILKCIVSEKNPSGFAISAQRWSL